MPGSLQFGDIFRDQELWRCVLLQHVQFRAPWLLPTQFKFPQREDLRATVPVSIGLFIVVAGMEKTSLQSRALALASGFGLDQPPVLAFFAALLSNLVSNVPAVLVFKPFIPHLANARQGWLVLAMATTLAGNLTVLGSVANLIVIQRAHREVEISYWEYFKVGAPLTLISILVGLMLLRRV